MPSLADRKLWFVGIGGAGLSGYAVLAKAWGAEVAGWDQHETPYLEHVRAAGIPVTVSEQVEAAPDGFEVVVSTAYLSQCQTLDMAGRAGPSFSPSSCRSRTRSSSPALTARRRRPG